MIATLRSEDRLKIQVQLDGQGDRADDVTSWFDSRYPHLECACGARPGLTISVTLPSSEDEHHTWMAQLFAATGPLDLAIEVVGECFLDLGLPLGRVVSLHLTD